MEFTAFIPTSSLSITRRTHVRRNVNYGVGLMMMDAPSNSSPQQQYYDSLTTAADTLQLQPATTFEAQVNTPALISFLVIAIVFSLLQFRINAIRDAAERREEALQTLRKVKAAELSGDDNDISTNTKKSKPTTEQVRIALNNYETSLKEELDLRTVIPGVRIVAPNDPKKREEDLAAAKQFLGLDLNDVEEQDNDEKVVSSKKSDKSVVKVMDEKEKKKKLLLTSRRRFDGKSGTSNNDVQTSATTGSSDGEGISFGAKAVLFAVALSLSGLLVILSFDPMTTSDVFTSIGGDPPANVPLSSW